MYRRLSTCNTRLFVGVCVPTPGVHVSLLYAFMVSYCRFYCCILYSDGLGTPRFIHIPVFNLGLDARLLTEIYSEM